MQFQGEKEESNGEEGNSSIAITHFRREEEGQLKLLRKRA